MKQTVAISFRWNFSPVFTMTLGFILMGVVATGLYALFSVLLGIA